MKKWAPVIIIGILITGALIGYARIPQVKELVDQKILKRTPPSVDKTKDEGYDPADQKVSPNPQANGNGPTEQEVLYGEVYLDDQRVSIVDGKFEPESITVKAGTTIIWTNKDKVKHGISVVGGAETPDLAPGKEGAIIFRQVGSYTYTDRLNENLKGTVIVE